ncbi:MAG: hypothetical protein KDB80_13120 [Planctomycetes bacterium]|nr:hypothetical protein [Planctomycetota bacterium]
MPGKNYGFVAFALLCAACAAPVQWREIDREDSLDSIWEQFAQMASTSGFMPDAKTDRGLRRYVSKWRHVPGPTLFRPGRVRLHGEFERPDSGAGWKVRFYVEKQVVKDIGVSTQSTTEDDWSDAGQDVTKEEILLGKLRVRFGQAVGVTPTHERR